MAQYRLFVDSNNGVDIDPEYNYTEKDKKMESKQRVRSGDQYVYKWGDYEIFKFGIMHVNSSFKSIVNSWWNTNTNLLFMEVGATKVSTVRLSNKALPIGKPIKPYTDSFKGVIELEGY